jgi:hypothetical protein
LRNQELKQAGIKRKQVWRPRDRPDGLGRTAPTCMVVRLQLTKLYRKKRP